MKKSFWAFSPDVWLELLGADYYAYVGVHGVTANARATSSSPLRICSVVSRSLQVWGGLRSPRLRGRFLEQKLSMQ